MGITASDLICSCRKRSAHGMVCLANPGDRIGNTCGFDLYGSAQHGKTEIRPHMEYLSVRELHRLFKHKRRPRLNGSPFLMQKSIHGSSEKYADGL